MKNTLIGSSPRKGSTSFSEKLTAFIFTFLFVAGAVFYLSASLTSCANSLSTENLSSTDLSALYGTWSNSSGEKYEISYNSCKDVAWDMFDMTDLVFNPVSSTEGYIYGKTREVTWENYPTPTYGEMKWYTVHYQDLGDQVIQLAGASGSSTYCSSLAEVRSEQTVDKGYFAYHSILSKE